jgi:DNA-binding beta-propeller fold protein YncE
MRKRNLVAPFVVAGLATLAVVAIVSTALVVPGCDSGDDHGGIDVKIGSGNPVTDDRPATRALTTRPTAAAAAPLRDAPLNGFKDYQGDVQPDRNLAKVIQTIKAFDRPAGCAVSLDRKYLFVTNSSWSQSGGFRHYKGSISKLEILPDGRLKMLKPDFVTQVHAPMGIAPLPKATRGFPAGALFVATGATSAVDDKDAPVTDIKKFNTGVSVFDPESGRLIGFIPMGPGRAVPRTIQKAVVAPTGLCFDADANLYLTDAGNTGNQLEPEVTGWPGIIRIRHQHIDTYAANETAINGAAWMTERHIPGAVYFSPLDNALYWSTTDGTPAGGAVNRIAIGDFPAENGKNNVLGDMGAIRGVTITPKGTLVISRDDGDLSLMTARTITQVAFPEDGSFSSPFEIKLHTLPNGNNVLYVPEQDPTSLQENQQRLRVILLPSAM